MQEKGCAAPSESEAIGHETACSLRGRAVGGRDRRHRQAGGLTGGDLWTVTLTEIRGKIRAETERGVEAGRRRSRCEGSSRGARSCGGCRARTRAELVAPVTLLFLPGLQRACSPPMISAPSAPPTPPGRGLWSLPLCPTHLEPPGTPPRGSSHCRSSRTRQTAITHCAPRSPQGA